MGIFRRSQWAEQEFGGAQLGHRARTKRLVRIAKDLSLKPASSFPKIFADGGQTKAAYRFFSNDAVTHSEVLSGHVQQSAKRCADRATVLILQDTTSLSFSTHHATTGLGPVNDHAAAQGLFAHTSLAVDAQSHEVLGVLAQQIWVRKKTKANEKNTYARRKRRRESEHWAMGQERSADILRSQSTAANSPRVMAVFDREGDVFEALEALDRLGHSFVIRAVHNRLVDERDAPGTRDKSRVYSIDSVAEAPVRGKKNIEVPARPGQKQRSAELTIRARSILIRPPSSVNRQGESLAISIVVAKEESPPDKCEAVCWYLLTREAIETEQDVLAVVRAYQARWLIEEFHMAVKTGCAMEERQLQTRQALENFLAVASVMACQLLSLRDAARSTDTNIAADKILTKPQLKVLHALQPKLKPNCSAVEALRAIAQLGGYMGSRNARPPGWRTLWGGLQTLMIAEAGYHVAVGRSG